jgi:hypothetical protein
VLKPPAGKWLVEFNSDMSLMIFFEAADAAQNLILSVG